MIFRKRLLVNFLNKYFEKILCGGSKGDRSVEMAASDLRSRINMMCGQLQTDFFYDLIMEILKRDDIKLYF